MHVFVYVDVDVDVNVDVDVDVDVNVDVYTHIYIYIYIHTYVCICMYMYACVCIVLCRSVQEVDYRRFWVLHPEICLLDTGPAGHAADCVARAGLDLSKSKSGRLFTCAGVPWPLTHPRS